MFPVHQNYFCRLLVA